MRKNNLLLRVKIAIQFIFQNKNGRIMTCGRCGSINIRPLADSEKDEKIHTELENKGVRRIWSQINICQNCNATVIERQFGVW